jgi:hypothetical protein
LVAAVGGLLGGLAAAGIIGGGHSGGSARTSGRQAGGGRTGSRPIVVRLEQDGRLILKGFFTPKGFIVTPGLTPIGTNVSAAWSYQGRAHRAGVAVVKTGAKGVYASMLLLRLVGQQGPRVNYQIRLAGSLHRGEPVEGYLEPRQIAPGRVTRVVVGKGYEERVRLMTTKISYVGDAGAPVLDSAGRVVGVIIAKTPSNGTESVSMEEVRSGSRLRL